ncbi:STAS domain-containing protein [Actinoplanes sp. URMC 104]|uniref:STAS domain-containing protein n=1 Tax=Actinoplanes sp. URMC 104 TaxID=3423409 RepID=UPI003F194838
MILVDSLECCPSAMLRGSVERREPTVLLRLHGEVDLDTADHLSHLLDLAGRGRPQRVVVDLAGVGFLGAAGLRPLAAYAYRLARGDCRLDVTNARPVVREVLRIGGIPTAHA